MAKIIITCEKSIIQEIELLNERMTIGRKPYNDIVIDHRGVSGQHASVTLMLDDAILEDLGSTNGTFVNEQKIARHKLVDGDKFTLATYELQYVASPRKVAPNGCIEVESGAHSGKKLLLSKLLTTIGKPGSAVVAITYANGQYTAARIEGEEAPTINEAMLDDQPLALSHGDVFDLAGTRMTFLLK